jgi:hypothetical protein
MGNKKIYGELRYKDQGKVSYTIIEEKNEDLRDCLEIIYEDDEKRYDWHYYWKQDGKNALEHLLEINYESMKEGFVNHIHKYGYRLHKGEYQLLKEVIVIFISHKEYILDICKNQGLCQ